MKACVMCGDKAEIAVSWPVTEGLQKHEVCDVCAHVIWDDISKFNGTEAYMGFAIEPILL